MTQEYLKTLVKYNMETGELHWIEGAGPKLNGKLLSTISSDGRYKRVTINGIEYFQHRLIWLYMKGYFPKCIDHKNGNSLDNSWENLRETTQQENLCNRKQLRTNTSGVTGVCWDKSRNQWKVTLARKNLGRFDSFEEAVSCRLAALKANSIYTDRHGQKEI